MLNLVESFLDFIIKSCLWTLGVAALIIGTLMLAYYGMVVIKIITG